MIDPLGKEKEDASRRGFIRKAIAGVFGATILAKAADLYSIESKTGYVYVKRNGEVINNYQPQGSEPYLSQIGIFAFSRVPNNWVQCNGQLLTILDYQALYSLLFTDYGGDGVTTFALPDLRGRVPVGLQANSVTLGQAGGAETQTLTVNQIPVHSHNINVCSADGDQSSPQGAFIASDKSFNGFIGNPPSGFGNMNTQAIANTGGNQPVSIMQPFLTINYCIAMAGVYPSRS